MSDNTYIRGSNVVFDSPTSSITLVPLAGKTLNISGTNITGTNLIATSSSTISSLFSTNATITSLQANTMTANYFSTKVFTFGTVVNSATATVTGSFLTAGAYLYSCVSLTSSSNYSIGVINATATNIIALSQLLTTGITCAIVSNAFVMTNNTGGSDSFAVTFTKISSNQGIN